MGLVCFEVLGLIEIIMLSVVYFSKKRAKNYENKIYEKIIIVNLLGQILHLLSFYTIYNMSRIPIMNIIITKLYIYYLLTWLLLNVLYIFVVALTSGNSNKDANITKLLKMIFFVCMAVGAIVVVLSDVYSHNSNGEIYTYGSGVDFIYTISSIFVIITIIAILLNLKKDKIKKYIPMFIYIIVGTAVMLIQKEHPEILLITSCETFITILMYFTIENPDVKMLEEMTLLKDQADKANQAKSDFLSNMSHEIRTPLNAIVGFSESLKDDNLPAESVEKVDDIVMASNNLLEIVNGILDISKIEANKLEIINKEYDIKSVLDELIALTKARIGDRVLDFRVNIDPSLPRVLYGDNTRLKQVILNLLTNAVKYTKEGYVEFNVSSVIKDNVCRLIISVEDSGIGIKEESIPKLFSKFERLDVEKEITIEGTGLGLAITKRLVELMNGTIVVQSVYGKGSKFTISIDQRIIAAEPPIVHEAPKAQSKIIDAKGAKILVVDDNPLNIKVASVLLTKYHFNIDSAPNGQECLNKINSGNKYDIIFMDDMMPKMSGREALTHLKQIEGFNTPVIVLTANAITGMKQEYLNCGFDDYLSKPIEKLELERVIKEYISKNRNTNTNTTPSNNTSSILNKDFTIELPALAANTSEIPKISTDNSKKVLVVDDNEMNLKIALNALKKYEGLEIESTTSGSDAISKVIENNNYDLVLLDDMMPDLDGCNTLKNLRDIDGFKATTIMMTASSEDEVASKLQEYKFDGYLSKPFKKEDLDKVINDILNK